MSISIADEVKNLFDSRDIIIGNLRESISLIARNRTCETSTLAETNQKLFDRLKKLAIERVHPNDKEFDMKLLKGKGKKERIHFHSRIIERVDRISEELLPHFESIRDAINYQADTLKILRNISHLLKYKRSLDSNVIYRIGVLIFNLLFVSIEITKHEFPEAILFLYNFVHLKKNLGDIQLCKQVNADTFKALRQYQSFDQGNLLKSLRKSISFDPSLIQLFNFISQGLMPEYNKLIRKDLRQQNLDSLFEVYDEVLKNGLPNINQLSLSLDNQSKSFIELTNVSFFQIVATIYMLCPTLFLMKKEGHFNSLKKILSHNLFLNVGDDKISIHDEFQAMTAFFPNKKKIRRKSKAQQLVTFTQYLNELNVPDEQTKSSEVLSSFDSETISSKLDSFDSTLKDYSVECFSVKDFIITIDLDAYRECLLEGKAGALLIIKESMINLQALFVELKSAINLVSMKPEVCSPVAQQLIHLCQLSKLIISQAESVFQDISESSNKKRCGKIAGYISRHLLNELSRKCTDNDQHYTKRFQLLRGLTQDLEIVIKSEKENILSYLGVGANVTLKDGPLLEHHLTGDGSTTAKYNQISAQYRACKVLNVLETLAGVDSVLHPIL